MTNSITINRNSIYELLSQNNFLINGSLREDFKCVICNNVLINPYRSVCGCNFCQKCIEHYETSGGIYCPGSTEECAVANVSDVLPDPKMNRNISQLVVKCPEKMCTFESSLKDLCEHLRFCPKKSVKCPFNDIGCDRGVVSGDELHEHLDEESYSHTRILIDVIGNMRNEMAELRQNAARNNAIIESMSEEIKAMKLEKAALQRQVDDLRAELEDRVGRIGADNDARFGDMRREWADSMRPWRASQGHVTARIDAMEKCLNEKVDAGFVRKTIDEMEDIRRTINMPWLRGLCADRFDATAAGKERSIGPDSDDSDIATTESSDSHKDSGPDPTVRFWTCTSCTYINGRDELSCLVCCSPRADGEFASTGRRYSSLSQKKSRASTNRDRKNSSPDTWTCWFANCHRKNKPSADYCESCHLQREPSDNLGASIKYKHVNGIKAIWICPKCNYFNDFGAVLCKNKQCRAYKYNKS